MVSSKSRRSSLRRLLEFAFHNVFDESNGHRISPLSFLPEIPGISDFPPVKSKSHHLGDTAVRSLNEQSTQAVTSSQPVDQKASAKSGFGRAR